MIDALRYHQNLRGKIVYSSKEALTKENLSTIYTPGVAKVSSKILKNKNLVNQYTGKKNSVAIVTDGSAVLGLGNIGPEAALPVMEGKAAIFAEFANINATPICLDTQDPNEIIDIVKKLAPSFGGINLEDISAPNCFDILSRLEEELDIPVFHDDQDGTAIVVLAGLINALKITGRDNSAKIVISGAGAAGIAIARLLKEYGLNNYCLCDSGGVLSGCRTDLSDYKKKMIEKSQAVCPCSNCSEALMGADILIGVSVANQFTARDIKKMNKDSIVFALANPVPEIMPQVAKEAGAKVVATGGSDFPNQINNALVFPGLFRGILDNEIQKITPDLKISVANKIAKMIKKPTPLNFIPSLFDDNLVKEIANAIKKSN